MMPALKETGVKTLSLLLDGIVDAPEIVVPDICTDSRQVKAGGVFFALQGETHHGIEFFDDVVARGAAAVVCDAAAHTLPDTDVTLIAVPELASQLGLIANRFFDYPSHALRLAGITGTNGKTTVATLIRQCLMRQGLKAGYLGTIGFGVNTISDSAALTTPVCFDTHRYLAKMQQSHASHAAMEVSSHALTQGRVDGVAFDAALFTNLSRDHIDYHVTMDAYFEAKASLFLDYDVNSRIINIDCEYGEQLAARCTGGVVTVSTDLKRATNGRPYVFLRHCEADAGSTLIKVDTSWGAAEFSLSMPGDFNVENALMVLAYLLCQDIQLEEATQLLKQAEAPAGRMQRIGAELASVPQVYVDYSHTPASLEAALLALRPHCQGKLWCVFGCGGDRDKGKRPMMGAVAQQLADRVIVTNDNPRSEDPQQIADEICQKLQSPMVKLDRGDAIQYALTEAAAADVVLIAGKGHENYQIIGASVKNFSDAEVAQAVLTERSCGGQASD